MAGVVAASDVFVLLDDFQFQRIVRTGAKGLFPAQGVAVHGRSIK